MRLEKKSLNASRRRSRDRLFRLTAFAGQSFVPWAIDTCSMKPFLAFGLQEVPEQQETEVTDAEAENPQNGSPPLHRLLLLLKHKGQLQPSVELACLYARHPK
jgi:hypothetical protein